MQRTVLKSALDASWSFLSGPMRLKRELDLRAQGSPNVVGIDHGTTPSEGHLLSLSQVDAQTGSHEGSDLQSISSNEHLVPVPLPWEQSQNEAGSASTVDLTPDPSLWDEDPLAPDPSIWDGWEQEEAAAEPSRSTEDLHSEIPLLEFVPETDAMRPSGEPTSQLASASSENHQVTSEADKIREALRHFFGTGTTMFAPGPGEWGKHGSYMELLEPRPDLLSFSPDAILREAGRILGRLESIIRLDPPSAGQCRELLAPLVTLVSSYNGGALEGPSPAQSLRTVFTVQAIALSKAQAKVERYQQERELMLQVLWKIPRSALIGAASHDVCVSHANIMADWIRREISKSDEYRTPLREVPNLSQDKALLKALLTHSALNETSTLADLAVLPTQSILALHGIRTVRLEKIRNIYKSLNLSAFCVLDEQVNLASYRHARELLPSFVMSEGWDADFEYHIAKLAEKDWYLPSFYGTFPKPDVAEAEVDPLYSDDYDNPFAD